MKQYIFLILALSLLTSCTKSTDTSSPNSPYPSVPLSIGSGGAMEVPPLATKNASGSSWSARGTEPFWNVEVTPLTSILSRPGETEVISTSFDTEQSDKGSIISIRGVKGDFFLTLTQGECSDGMSETKYAYSATVNVGAEELKGCANKK